MEQLPVLGLQRHAAVDNMFMQSFTDIPGPCTPVQTVCTYQHCTSLSMPPPPLHTHKRKTQPCHALSCPSPCCRPTLLNSNSRSMKEYSRYVVVVDNLSSNTPTKDIEYEFSFAGRIRCV